MEPKKRSLKLSYTNHLHLICMYELVSSSLTCGDSVVYFDCTIYPPAVELLNNLGVYDGCLHVEPPSFACPAV